MVKAILTEHGEGGGGGGSPIVLSSLTIDTMPTKLSYISGETFDPTDMVVKSHYTLGGFDFQTVTCTGYAYYPDGALSVNDNKVTISYSEAGVVQTVDVPITVVKRTLDIPTQTEAIVYDGSGHTPSWTNYDATYMSKTVDTAQTNAGSYSTTFTLLSPTETEWEDQTIEDKTVQWTIDKMPITIDVTPTSLTLDKDHMSGSATFSIVGDGTVSISADTALSASISGNTINISTEGKKTGTLQVTVSASEGTNWAKPVDVVITVQCNFWSWDPASATDDSKAPVADADWWANTKSAIAEMSESELSALVGRQVKITIPFTITGSSSYSSASNTHLVRCVGYNCDHDKSDTTKNTITLQTSNIVGTDPTYYNNSAISGFNNNLYWVGSYIRERVCKAYQTAFENTYGTGILCTTSQGTCPTTNNNQNGTLIYNDEVVFLPSDCQMGFPPGHDYSNNKGYSASYNEYDQYNTAKQAYQYYTSDARRIKTMNGNPYYYWERSLYYVDTITACAVGADGKPTTGNYGSSYGFAPAYVI